MVIKIILTLLLLTLPIYSQVTTTNTGRIEYVRIDSITLFWDKLSIPGVMYDVYYKANIKDDWIVLDTTQDTFYVVKKNISNLKGYIIFGVGSIIDGIQSDIHSSLDSTAYKGPWRLLWREKKTGEAFIVRN